MKSVGAGSAGRAHRSGQHSWPRTSGGGCTVLLHLDLSKVPGKKSALPLPVRGGKMVWTIADNKDAV